MGGIAYVTAGSVGAGHLARGAALGHALRRAGHRGPYTVIGPQRPFPQPIPFERRDVAIDGRQLSTPAGSEASELARVLLALAPERIVVDLFWAPMRFVLPLLPAPAWLLLRKVPALWFQGPPGIPFVPQQYARVLAIEPCAPPVAHEQISPLVLDDGSPPASREALAARLGRAPDQPLHVVLQAGVAGEIETLSALAPPEAVAWDLHDATSPFPASPWLAAADGITCGAGYNAFWEAVHFRRRARTRFHPFTRTLDDQAWRMGLSTTGGGENGADALARALLRG